VSEGTPFAPKGVVSQRSACLEIFQGMEVGDWLQADDLAHRIETITGAVCKDSYAPAWAAAQHLAAGKEGAWAFYRGGWKRLRAEEQFSNVVARGARHRRGQRRLVRWVENALSNEAISGPDRHVLEVERRTQLQQAQIDAQRNARRRPAEVEPD
jgi:hypothetical protein